MERKEEEDTVINHANLTSCTSLNPCWKNQGNPDYGGQIGTCWSKVDYKMVHQAETKTNSG